MTAATMLPEPQTEDIASLIETAQILGATTALIRRDRDVDFKRGRPGIGSLVIVDDLAPSTGPRCFDAGALSILDRAHGVFVVADVGDDGLATLVITAMGANVGVVLTHARRVPEWERYLDQIVPRTLRMTCIGGMVQPTVDVAGTA
jgi:hypothetical protein